MRVYLAFAISATFVLNGVNPSFAAPNCPSSALKAGFELWPVGQLPFGETRSGSHPCGKSVTCIGGNPHRGVLRTCEWK
jgi:hypothetical protein